MLLGKNGRTTHDDSVSVLSSNQLLKNRDDLANLLGCPFHEFEKYAYEYLNTKLADKSDNKRKDMQ